VPTQEASLRRPGVRVRPFAKWWAVLGWTAAALAVAGLCVRGQGPGGPGQPGSVQRNTSSGGNAELAAWYLEHDHAIVIPDSVLATLVPSSYDVVFRPAGPTAANRNNNPLNIKVGGWTAHHVTAGHAAVSDTVALDGGRFLRFATPEAGFRAGVLLLSTPLYAPLTVDQALRKWSNHGYGAEVLAGRGPGGESPIAGLGRAQLKVLLAAMARAEGYRSTALELEIARSLGW